MKFSYFFIPSSLKSNYFFNFTLDAPEHFQLSFQDGSSSTARELILFHDYILFFVLFILFSVGVLMVQAYLNNEYYPNFFMHVKLEFFWTLLPVFILLAIVIPSLKLLYWMDESFFSPLTIKAIGHQWYWSYEYPESLNSFEFDSYLTPSSDLKNGFLRLLEVDHKLILPTEVTTRMMVTSTDVIHSFACPSLGIKVDAIPGRLNQGYIFSEKVGSFYGQCSEICGSDHSFMPIAIQTLPLPKFMEMFNK